MTLRKLLAAASIVALTAGSAHAIELDVDTTNSQFGVNLANELEITEDQPVSGTIDFDVTLTNDGSFPAGSNMEIIVNLPADGSVVFGSGIEGGSVQGISAGGNVQGTVFGDNGDGETDVEFRLAVENDDNVETIQFQLPVDVIACPAAGSAVTVTIETAGEFVENDTDGASDNDELGETTLFLPCASAINGSHLADGSAKEILLDPYTEIAAGDPATGMSADNADEFLGSVTIDVAGDVGTNADGDALNPTTDVSTVDFAITLGENNAGIDGFIFACGADTFAAPTTPNSLVVVDTTWTYSIDGSEFPQGASTTVCDIFIRNLVNAPMISQSVTVDTTVNLTQNVTAPYFHENDDVDEDGMAVTEDWDGPLDSLDREGIVFGTFDWVGSNVALTVSVIRVTGLSGNEDIPYTVNFTNVNSDDASLSGTFSGVFTESGPGGFTENGGEAILFSHTGFGTSNTDYGRADIEICVETTEDMGLDMDLLLGNVGTGLVTSFGGGENMDSDGDELEPSMDSDNIPASP